MSLASFHSLFDFSRAYLEQLASSGDTIIARPKERESRLTARLSPTRAHVYTHTHVYAPNAFFALDESNVDTHADGRVDKSVDASPANRSSDGSSWAERLWGSEVDLGDGEDGRGSMLSDTTVSGESCRGSFEVRIDGEGAERVRFPALTPACSTPSPRRTAARGIGRKLSALKHWQRGSVAGSTPKASSSAMGSSCPPSTALTASPPPPPPPPPPPQISRSYAPEPQPPLQITYLGPCWRTGRLVARMTAHGEEFVEPSEEQLPFLETDAPLVMSERGARAYVGTGMNPYAWAWSAESVSWDDVGSGADGSGSKWREGQGDESEVLEAGAASDRDVECGEERGKSSYKDQERRQQEQAEKDRLLEHENPDLNFPEKNLSRIEVSNQGFHIQASENANPGVSGKEQRSGQYWKRKDKHDDKIEKKENVVVDRTKVSKIARVLSFAWKR